MRIIAGIAKSQKLKSIRGLRVRPTSDRVKESLFSILGSKIVNARVLDLFAGTGNLGLESLSRGAAFAVFVDNDIQSINVIKQNIANLGFTKSTFVVHGELPAILKYIKKKLEFRSQKLAFRNLASESCDSQIEFDVVFLDPPYLDDLELPTIEALIVHRLLNSNALVVVEHHKKTDMPVTIRHIRRIRQEKYGDTIITFYQNYT
ncbi:MAG: 16S rRNA (guanine(966)-N(2))-methyltransferase RsmD [bacterium]|nr:16S rRNA (guanine(966)-N(2))-methyltransferase RsmD [bacterium]